MIRPYLALSPLPQHWPSLPKIFLWLVCDCVCVPLVVRVCVWARTHVCLSLVWLCLFLPEHIKHSRVVITVEGNLICCIPARSLIKMFAWSTDTLTGKLTDGSYIELADELTYWLYFQARTCNIVSSAVVVYPALFSDTIAYISCRVNTVYIDELEEY